MTNQNQINTGKEQFFSIELKDKTNLKNLSITTGESENIIFEGNLGELLKVGFTEGIVLEVVGKTGILTVDLSEVELKKFLQENSSKSDFP